MLKFSAATNFSMNYLKEKTRFIFSPVIILAIVFTTGYGLLYWLFYIHFGLNSIKENVVDTWMPIGLGFICVFLLIRPRVHLLQLDADNGKIRGLYYIVATAIISIPTILLLDYLETATGKLTVLDNATEVTHQPASKYYQFNRYVLDKENVGIRAVKSYSGKRNESINYDLYLAVPMPLSFEDSTQPVSVFLGKKYHEQIPSKLSDEMQKIKWESFWEESFTKFDNEISQFTYLKRVGNTETRDELLIAAGDCKKYKLKTPFVILEPMPGSFSKRNGNSLNYAFLAFGIGVIVWFLFVSIPAIHVHKLDKMTEGENVSVKEQLRKIYNDIKPRKGFVATPLLVAANLFVFILLVLDGFGFMAFRTQDLIRAGALFEPLMQKGDWWRLVSSMFLHGGFFHLLMNMVSLVLAGIFLEIFIGTKKFTLSYFLSGVVAGLVSMWWHDENAVAVGASGAIFGLYGILIAFMICRVFDPSFNKLLFILLLSTAGFSLLMGFLSKGIDNSAHIGGLLAGLIIGFFFAIDIKKHAVAE